MSILPTYLGSFKSGSYLKLMNWQADKATKRLSRTGQITVIVQDKYPIHESEEIRHNVIGRSKKLFPLLLECLLA